MPRLVLFLALFASVLLNAAVINYNKLEGCQSNFTNCLDGPPATTTAAPSNITEPNCSTKFYSCMGNVVEDIRKPKPCYQAETAKQTFKNSLSITGIILSFTIALPLIPMGLIAIARKVTENERECFNGWLRAIQKIEPAPVAENPTELDLDTITLDSYTPKLLKKLKVPADQIEELQDSLYEQIELTSSCCLKFLQILTEEEPIAQGDGKAAQTVSIAAKAADSVFEKMTRATFGKISALLGAAYTFVSVGWIFNLWKDSTVQEATCRFCMEARSPTDESVRSCYW
ncbi:MAG: hypothetical protein JKY15_06870 [Deltaproteobacteria bacterium]|nr:hypothetical protein [Deltaproteobacteria bacterium]